MLAGVNQLVDLRRDEAEVAALDCAVDIDNRGSVVMAHDRRRHRAVNSGEVGEQLRAAPAAAVARAGGAGGRATGAAGDRGRCEIAEGGEAELWSLGGDRVLRATLGVYPEGQGGLRTARQRHQQIR